MIELNKRRTVAITKDELRDILGAEEGEVIRFVGKPEEGISGQFKFRGEDGRNHTQEIRGGLVFEILEVKFKSMYKEQLKKPSDYINNMNARTIDNSKGTKELK